MKNAFCFIICTNNALWFNECSSYIEKLIVPDGYEVSLLAIEEAKSMASGYNEGMLASDAKYKIYLHQDTFIINKFFLFDILEIFKDDSIGLIGVVGSPVLSPDGVMWHCNRIGTLYGNDPVQNTPDYSPVKTTDCSDVDCVDGLIMITSKDIPWREDIFDGWDFYDVSQCFEFRKKGYRVVVPNQKSPWINHDAGKAGVWNYDKYRRIFLDEYKDMLN